MTGSDAARAAALEARRMHGSTHKFDPWPITAKKAIATVRRNDVRLFHGTTSLVSKVTPQRGLDVRKGVYLSTRSRDAREFAMQAVSKKGGNPVVYMVRASKQPNLRLEAGTGKRGTTTWFTTGKQLTNPKRLKITGRRW